MVQREDVAFGADGGVTLRGWLFLPDGPGPHPAITMAHGYAGVRDHGLEPFARAFAEAGFAVLLHDHRNFGASDGLPRQDIDPWRQIADWRRAISYLESRPEVAADRIGLWGTSYAGGHAIVLGATDRRVRAVVSQVPTISGFEQGRRRIAPEAVSKLEAAFDEDERAQARGEAPAPRPSSATTRPSPPPTARRKPSTSTSSPYRRACGATRSRSAPTDWPACTSPGPGSLGSPPRRCSWWSPRTTP